MFFVYVLQSKTNGRFYTGQTSDIQARLVMHESGTSPSTKGRGPWQLVHQEIFTTRAEAMRREKEFKTGKGREELKTILAQRDRGCRGDLPK